MTDLRVAKARRGPALSFTFDGLAIEAYEGESVAAALIAAGVVRLRRAPADHAPRGAFCMMGLCQECVVSVGGTRVEACRILVSDQLAVTSVE